MIVQAFQTRGRGRRGFLLIDEDTRDALMIDPAEQFRAMSGFLASQRARLAGAATTDLSPEGRRRLIRGVGGLGIPIASRGGISFGRRAVTVLPSPDGLGALIKAPGHLFTGTLLSAGDIPAETGELRRQRAAWLRELLLGLPPKLRIEPSHGPTSEIGLELTFNRELWG